MRAAATLLALLVATPASAGCQPLPAVRAWLKGGLPARAYVEPVTASSLPTVLAWLESRGLPHRATAILQVVGDPKLGMTLVLFDGGQACEGAPAIRLTGDQASELIALVTRFHELTGRGPERSA